MDFVRRLEPHRFRCLPTALPVNRPRSFRCLPSTVHYFFGGAAIISSSLSRFHPITVPVSAPISVPVSMRFSGPDSARSPTPRCRRQRKRWGCEPTPLPPKQRKYWCRECRHFERGQRKLRCRVRGNIGVGDERRRQTAETTGSRLDRVTGDRQRKRWGRTSRRKRRYRTLPGLPLTVERWIVEAMITGRVRLPESGSRTPSN